MIMVLKKLAVDEFLQKEPWLCSAHSREECTSKDIVFNYLEEETLKDVPMLYCSKKLILFGEDPVIDSSFYVMSGANEDGILLFLGTLFSRSQPSQPSRNSVRLWHQVKILYSEDAFSKFEMFNRQSEIEKGKECETNTQNGHQKGDVAKVGEHVVTTENKPHNNEPQKEIVEVD